MDGQLAQQRSRAEQGSLGAASDEVDGWRHYDYCTVDTAVKEKGTLPASFAATAAAVIQNILYSQRSSSRVSEVELCMLKECGVYACIAGI